MSNKVLRSTASMALLCAGGLAVAGCFGPTYGTGVTATDQLFDDLNNAISLGDRTPPPQINYTPRPDIVQPADPNTLPPPQESIATVSGDWPESPEERRARVRQEADDGLRDPNFIANRRDAEAIGASEGPDRVQASAVRRVYLTDPPTEYRQPAETAAYGDLGATESQKERAAKRAQGEKTGWRRFLPF